MDIERLKVSIEADTNPLRQALIALRTEIQRVLQDAEQNAQRFSQSFSHLGAQAGMVAERYESEWKSANDAISSMMTGFTEELGNWQTEFLNSLRSVSAASGDVEQGLGEIISDTNTATQGERAFGKTGVEQISSVSREIDDMNKLFELTKKAITAVISLTPMMKDAFTAAARMTIAVMQPVKAIIQDISKTLMLFYDSFSSTMSDATKDKISELYSFLEQINKDIDSVSGHLEKSFKQFGMIYNLNSWRTEIKDNILQVRADVEDALGYVDDRVDQTNTHVTEVIVHSIDDIRHWFSQLGEFGSIGNIRFNIVPDEETQRIQQLRYELAHSDDALQRWQQHMAESFEPRNRFQSAMDSIGEALDRLKHKFSDGFFVDTTDFTVRLSNLKNQITAFFTDIEYKSGGVKEAFRNLFPTTLREDFAHFAQIGPILQKTGQVIHNVVSKIVTVAHNMGTAFRKATSTIKKTFAGVTAPIKRVYDRIHRVTKRFVGLFTRAFIFTVAMRGFRALRSTLSELLKQNEEMNKSISKLKGSFYGAVAPILNWALPKIAKLIDYLSLLFAKIAQFTSKLFGITIEDTKKLAEQMNDASESVKNSVMSFDELNQLNGQDSAFGFSTEDLDTLETGYDLLERFKLKLKELAKTINDYVYDKLKQLPTLFSQLGQKITQAIKKIDFGSIGRWFATGLNTINDTIISFFENTDFEALGKGLNTFFKNLVEKLDTKKLARAVDSAIDGLLDLVFGFLNGEYDWGQGLEIVFTTILSAIQDLCRPGKNTINRLTSIIGKLIEDSIQSLFTGGGLLKSLQEFFTGNKFDSFLGSIVETIFNALGDLLIGAVRGLIQGVVDLINVFIRGVNKVFDAGWEEIDISEWLNNNLQYSSQMKKDKKTSDSTPYKSSSGVEHSGGGYSFGSTNTTTTTTQNNGLINDLANAMANRPIQAQINVDGKTLADIMMEEMNYNTKMGYVPSKAQLGWR